MSECSRCHEVLASPLACGSCEALFVVSGELSPFAVFGVAQTARLDQSVLRKRLLELQRLMHPDFHGQAGAALQGIAEHNTAELNAAFEVLRDETKRASYLVEMLGGPSESAERQMPQAFLMEVMQWNETLEDLKAEIERVPAEVATKLADFHAHLNLKRAQLVEDILDAVEHALEDPKSSDLDALRRKLNAVRYIDRAQDEANQTRLAAETAAR